MNLIITADNILSVASDLQSRVNSLEIQLEKLTGQFNCKVMPAAPEFDAAEGTLGAKLGESFQSLVLIEHQLSNMLCHLRDNVLETTSTNLTAPVSKRLEPETVEVADLPRFLKRAPDEALSAAVARDLGVEQF